MEVTTKSRAELKARFVKNSIPTEKDFANLIDGLINLQDDGVVKAAGNPLSIQADGESSGPQKVLNLYSSLKDANPAWSLSLNPRSDPNNASSARPGFNLSDSSGANRLFVDRTSGNVGVGTITPGAKLEVNGSLTASGITTLHGNVGIGRAPDHALHIAVAKSVRFELGSGQKLSLGGNGALEVDAPNVVGGRFVVTDGGNVGIGTASPNTKLTVEGATATTAIETVEIVRLVRPVHSGVKSRNSAGLRVGSFETGMNGRTRLDIALSGGPGPANDHGSIPDVTVMSLLANGNVGIGTTSPAQKLTVSGTADHLQLRREATETTGGKVLFLELYQNDPQTSVPEVFPNIRFHHNNRFWHRIEARSNGFHLKEGYLDNDGYVSLYMGTGYVSGNLAVPGGDETLRMLRGIVNSDGTVFAGNGFTARRASTGLFDITFNTPFPSIPGASATQIFGRANTGTETATHTGGDTRDNAIIAHLSANMMRVKTGDGAGTASDRVFSFVVIGPR